MVKAGTLQCRRCLRRTARALRDERLSLLFGPVRDEGCYAYAGALLVCPEYGGFREIYQRLFIFIRTQETIGTDDDHVPQALKVAFISSHVEDIFAHFRFLA
jgi:hypothetical protein